AVEPGLLDCECRWSGVRPGRRPLLRQRTKFEPGMGGKGQARRAPREPVTDTELAVDRLRPFLLDLFRAYGTPEPNAAGAVDHLLDSSACGLPSHGVLGVPDYIDAIETGAVDPAAEPQRVADGSVLV